MKQVLIWVIRAYQQLVPNKFKRCCLYKESCSNYAIRVIERAGFFKGSFLTIERLLKCRPGYQIVSFKGSFRIKLRNGEYVNEQSVSPVILESYRKALDFHSQNLNRLIKKRISG